MTEQRIANMVLIREVTGNRRRDRPESKWENQVAVDLQTLGMKIRWENAKDKKTWEEIRNISLDLQGL